MAAQLAAGLPGLAVLVARHAGRADLGGSEDSRRRSRIPCVLASRHKFRGSKHVQR